MKLVDLSRENVEPLAFAVSPNNVVARDLNGLGWARYLHCRLEVAVTLSGGSASGTVIEEPISPAGIVQTLEIRKTPGRFAGNVLTLPVDMLYYASRKLMRREPARTATPAGSAASHVARLEFLVPLSLIASFFGDASLLRTGDLTQYQLRVVYPTSASLARDALWSGNDRTADFTGTTLHVTQHLAYETPDTQYQTRWVYERVSPTAGVFEHRIRGLNPGERVRQIHLKTVDNGVRANTLIGNGTIALKIGQQTPISYQAAQLQYENASDWGLAWSSWPTGIYAIDCDPLGDTMRCPVRPSEGDVPRLCFGAVSAITAPAYIDVLYEVFGQSSGS